MQADHVRLRANSGSAKTLVKCGFQALVDEGQIRLCAVRPDALLQTCNYVVEKDRAGWLRGWFSQGHQQTDIAVFGKLEISRQDAGDGIRLSIERYLF